MVKTVYVPRFGSQRHSSQTNEPQEYLIELPSTCSQRKQSESCGCSSKMGKSTKFRNYATNNKTNRANKSVASPMLQYSSRPVSKIRRTAECETEETQSTSKWDFEPDCEEVPSVSQPSRRHKMDTNKEKLTAAVLRTISKMLRENRCFRQRLLALSQSCGLSRDPAGNTR